MTISGFPEWLPEERLVEEDLVASVRDVYRSHGFSSIDHPAVELLSTLEANGVEGKEIFVLRRAQGDESDDARLALHFDLTVPLARYVAENMSKIVFPLRRFSLQKVWRGERPQRGRYREFYQFDIGIVARESLPLACDAEVVEVIDASFRRMAIAPHRIRFNNRKILFGFYESLGLKEQERFKAIQIVDKRDKIGRDGVAAELRREIGLSDGVVEQIVQIGEVVTTPATFLGEVGRLSVDNGTFQEGVDEVGEVLRLLPESAKESLSIDLSLARGLGYYTGSILEVVFPEYPEFGSASGGGRYEGLAGRFSSQKLPAVGAAIGITRLMALLLEKKIREPRAHTSSKVLVTVYDEHDRPKAVARAAKLREAGIAAEVYFKSPKLGKQIEYADKKGIPFVLFSEDSQSDAIALKRLSDKEQKVCSSIDEAIAFVCQE